MENIMGIWKINKEYGEDEFLRYALISLTKDPKSPADIMDSSFEKVEEFEKQIVWCGTKVEVNFTGSIGYDKTEEYWDKEERKDSNGHRYLVDVKKTRTVTDWSPYSGSFTNEVDLFHFNELDDDNDFENLFPLIEKDIKDESFNDCNEFNIEDGLTNILIRRSEKSSIKNVPWPGDRQRDERYSYKSEIVRLYGYYVPYYSITYTYNEEEYLLRGFACGHINEIHNVPKANNKTKSVEDIRKQKEFEIDEAKEKNKFKVLSIVLAVVFGLASFIGLIIGLPLPGVVVIVIGLCLMIASIITAVLINRRIKQEISRARMKAIREERRLSNIKIDKLIAKLKSLGLPELNEEEKNQIKLSGKEHVN